MKFVIKQSFIVAACVSYLSLYLAFVLFSYDLLTAIFFVAVAFLAAFSACFVSLQLNRMRAKPEAWRERASWTIGAVACVGSWLLIMFVSLLFR